MSRLAVLFAIAATLLPLVAQAEVTLKKTDAGVEVTLDGKPFTTYLFKSGVKPILWPVIGPTGKEMTRAWPMREGNPDEKTDHVHQRSFWFTHGNVSGVDFWAETAKVQGRIEHQELVKAEGGKIGTIVTRNDWMGPDGAVLLHDERTLRFGGGDELRWIDFDSVLTAAADEVKFGDTKEGSFGLRIAESMRADRKENPGLIVNSQGELNKAAWGKPAAWVDYHGPVQGEKLGIAILNHPSSFRFPTHWHVREYGLFAANPWGLGDFTGGNFNGEHKLKKGETLTLRYRVIFHQGDEKQAKIDQAFKEYAAGK